VSEVDDEGRVMHEFTHVLSPYHLLSATGGHVLVADCDNHRILLLNSQLQPQRVLIERNSQASLRSWPSRLCHNELTSQLYVLHRSESGSDVILLFRLCHNLFGLC